MKFFLPTPFKILGSLCIFFLLLGVSISISILVLPNPHNVLGAMVAPDITPSPTAVPSASLNSYGHDQNIMTTILLALSPYTTYYSASLVYTKFITLIVLYMVSFVLACMLALIMNKPLGARHLVNYRKHHGHTTRR